MQLKFNADLTDLHIVGLNISTSVHHIIYSRSKWRPPKCFEIIKTVITSFKQCNSETLVFSVNMLFLNDNATNIQS